MWNLISPRPAANADHFDEHTSKVYFWQLICGLEHCHERGIAHRDLKVCFNLDIRLVYISRTLLMADIPA